MLVPVNFLRVNRGHHCDNDDVEFMRGSCDIVLKLFFFKFKLFFSHFSTSIHNISI